MNNDLRDKGNGFEGTYVYRDGFKDKVLKKRLFSEGVQERVSKMTCIR
jgi:hypothetical protein